MRNRNIKLLGLSQRGYIDRVLNKFNMENCNKGDKFCKDQCPKSEHEIKLMKMKPYASLVGSLMQANVCTRLDLVFIFGLLGRFQANPGEAYWVYAKKVLRYLQRIKIHVGI